jgi:enoyl-CoA hydratase/carnithine racemase
MSEFTAITCDTAGEVATLTLRRPQKLNALTDQINIELTRALDQIAETAAIKVIVLTGEGRAFSAGYDVSEGPDAPARTPPYWKYHFGLAYKTLRRIWFQPQPVVAKVRGYCLGGGFALAMAADLTYASEDVTFGDAEIKFGGGGNMFPVLQWTIGMKKLNELMLTGRMIRGPEALAIGIVNEVLPAAELDARVDQVIRHMCLLPAGTLVRNKRDSRKVYEAMGLGPLVDAMEDGHALGLAARPASEFNQRSQAEGVTSALRWQKQRFDEVGAFK